MRVGPRAVTLVDTQDAYLLRENSWIVGPVEYVNASPCQPAYTSLHRAVMNAPKGLVVDHINRNKLDNRRKNLRLCTQSENARNVPKRKGRDATSKYKGVFLTPASSKSPKPWYARIAVNGKSYSLGTYSTEIEAATAYDAAAKAHHKEFASLNFPEVD